MGQMVCSIVITPETTISDEIEQERRGKKIGQRCILKPIALY